MFICGALQISFVGVYGGLAIARPQTAVAWLLPFVAVVWVFVIHNNWRPIWTVLKAGARRYNDWRER